MRRPRTFGGVLKIVGMVIGGIILATLIAFLFGYFVMLLWNWLMPEIFGLGTISFWQAFGLALLARLLFGHVGGNHKSSDKGKCPPRDRDIPGQRDKWKRWKHFERFWEEKGRESYHDFLAEQESADDQGEAKEV